MIPALDVWSSVEQTAGVVLRTAIVYVVARAAVRATGRRTLAQFSAFDVVVTIAAGSVVASTALPPRPSVSDGLTALVTLLVLQAAVGAVRQRSDAVRRLVDFAPRVVVRDGRVEAAQRLTSAQLSVSDIRSQLRQQGVTHLAEVRLAVLEPNGQVSLLPVGADAGDLFEL